MRVSGGRALGVIVGAVVLGSAAGLLGALPASADGPRRGNVMVLSSTQPYGGPGPSTIRQIIQARMGRNYTQLRGQFCKDKSGGTEFVAAGVTPSAGLTCTP